MTLREMMARHARTVLTRPDHFGEELQFQPPGDVDPVTVRATVDRLDLVPDEMAGQVARRRARVAIPRDADVGVLAVPAGSKVILPMRVGDDPVTAKVLRIISQDEAMFLLEVQS